VPVETASSIVAFNRRPKRRKGRPVASPAQSAQSQYLSEAGFQWGGSTISDGRAAVALAEREHIVVGARNRQPFRGRRAGTDGGLATRCAWLHQQHRFREGMAINRPAQAANIARVTTAATTGAFHREPSHPQPYAFSLFLDRPVAQPVNENLDEPQHALLPTRLVVHVAHANQGTKQVLRADVIAYFARRDRALQELADGPR
jgi:hypothetical protein